jgi:hypothetical protein
VPLPETTPVPNCRSPPEPVADSLGLLLPLPSADFVAGTGFSVSTGLTDSLGFAVASAGAGAGFTYASM